VVNIINVLSLRNFVGEICYGEARNGLTAKGLVQRAVCKITALTPQKMQCEFENYYPAGTLNISEAATSPSRWDLVCKRRESGGQRW